MLPEMPTNLTTTEVTHFCFLGVSQYGLLHLGQVFGNSLGFLGHHS
jgi:hypothetical protein